jgi:AraC family transcriptional activator of tynA and feaB
LGHLARFTTLGLAPAERLVKWGAFISQAQGRLKTESQDGAPFSGTVNMGTIGPLRLFHIEASSHRLESMAGVANPTDNIRIVIQSKGSSIFSQGGRDVSLQSGCWTIWATNLPHVVTNLTDVEQVCLLIPRAFLGVSSSNILRHAGSRLGEHPGIGRLVPEYVMGLYEQIDSIDESLHIDMADIVAHMVRLALGETSRFASKETVRETMRTRVIEYVRHNLRDPNLSIERVAEKFGCSKRHLHKVFSDSGATLSQFVWRERLERCRAALANANTAHMSITEIAFMWGFNNSAHFSKAFREQYGMPPSLWRISALGALACAPQPH